MNNKKPIGYLLNVFKLQCPRCRQGKIFKNKLSLGISQNTAMHQKCSVCNQPTEIEVGFYVGTGYVSYALTVAITAATFVAWLVLIGISAEDNRIFWWLGSNAIFLVMLQPWLMRFCRSLWLSFFVKYNKNWATEQNFNNERTISNQMEGAQDISKKNLEK
jgi:hypothetical protein